MQSSLAGIQHLCLCIRLTCEKPDIVYYGGTIEALMLCSSLIKCSCVLWWSVESVWFETDVQLGISNVYKLVI